MPPDAAHVASRRRDRPARGVARRAGADRPPEPRRGGGRTRDRRARRRRRAAAGGRARRPRRRRRGGRRRRAGRRRGLRRPARRWRSCIRSSARPSTRTSRCTSAHSRTSAPPGCCAIAGVDAGTVATQLVHAPPRGEAWVVDVLEQAARAAQRAGAPASAVSYLTRALAEPPAAERRAKVLLSLAGSRPAEAERGAPARGAGADRRSAPPRHGDAAPDDALLMSGRAEEAVALARRAAAALPPEADVLLAALEAVEVTAALFGAGAGHARAHRPPTGVCRWRRAPGRSSLAAIAAHQWAYSGGSADECAALAAGRAGRRRSDLGRPPPSLGDRDDRRRARRPRRGGRRLGGAARTRRTRAGRWTSSRRPASAAATRSCATASWPTPRRRCATGSRSSSSAATTNGRMEIAAWLAAIERERGNLAAARRELEAVSDPGDASQAARYWLDSHAEQLLAEERFERGAGRRPRRREALRRHARDRHARARAPGARAPPPRATRGGAAARRRGGRSGHGAGARRRSSRGRCGSSAPSSSDPDAPARGRGVRGALAGAPGARQGAGRRGRRAARRPPAHRGARPAAPGLELADALGADALATQARQELYAAGGRPRTTALRGPAALTPAERRVAERAAAGQTNRAIAEALFVTPKTVELHLRNAYRKLGARNRHDLAGLLVVEAAPA